MFCTKHQENNYRAVSTTGLCGKHSFSGALARVCEAIPNTSHFIIIIITYLFTYFLTYLLQLSC